MSYYNERCFQQTNNATSTLISSTSVPADSLEATVFIWWYIPPVSVSTYKLPEQVRTNDISTLRLPTTHYCCRPFPQFWSSGMLRGRMHRSADAHKLYDSRGPRPRPQHAVIISRPLAASYIVGLHFSTIKLFSDGGRDWTFCLCSSRRRVRTTCSLFRTFPFVILRGSLVDNSHGTVAGKD